MANAHDESEHRSLTWDTSVGERKKAPMRVLFTTATQTSKSHVAPHRCLQPIYGLKTGTPNRLRTISVGTLASTRYRQLHLGSIATSHTLTKFSDEIIRIQRSLNADDLGLVSAVECHYSRCSRHSHCRPAVPPASVLQPCRRSRPVAPPHCWWSPRSDGP